MTDSMSLVTAQVSFLDTHLAIVHIPIEYYPFLLQPILRLLFCEEEHDEEESSEMLWSDRHDFLNISITPLECSIVCSRALARRVIDPIASQLNNLSLQAGLHDKQVEILDNDYIAIQVEGQGLNAGQRVLELTAPLAMAGISIFFITTYFCDYVLVPVTARHTVTKALQQRGFIFSEEASAFISQLSPTLTHGNFSEWPPPVLSNGSDIRPFSAVAPPTPPAKDIPELQIRTFSKLQSKNIQPLVDSSLRLFSCAGSRDDSEGQFHRLKDGLFQILLSINEYGGASGGSPKNGGIGLHCGHFTEPPLLEPARFLSVTLTAEPISVLLEARFLPRFGSALLGSTLDEDTLVPIMLDLSSLSWSATGIVGGVASRLTEGPVAMENPSESGEDSQVHGISPVEISFLSTARAGTVLVKASELDKAVRAMELEMQDAAQHH